MEAVAAERPVVAEPRAQPEADLAAAAVEPLLEAQPAGEAPAKRHQHHLAQPLLAGQAAVRVPVLDMAIAEGQLDAAASRVSEQSAELGMGDAADPIAE